MSRSFANRSHTCAHSSQSFAQAAAICVSNDEPTTNDAADVLQMRAHFWSSCTSRASARSVQSIAQWLAASEHTRCVSKQVSTKGCASIG
jgi:hypothetical protein